MSSFLYKLVAIGSGVTVSAGVDRLVAVFKQHLSVYSVHLQVGELTNMVLQQGTDTGTSDYFPDVIAKIAVSSSTWVDCMELVPVHQQNNVKRAVLLFCALILKRRAAEFRKTDLVISSRILDFIESAGKDMQVSLDIIRDPRSQEIPPFLLPTSRSVHLKKTSSSGGYSIVESSLANRDSGQKAALVRIQGVSAQEDSDASDSPDVSDYGSAGGAGGSPPEFSLTHANVALSGLGDTQVSRLRYDSGGASSPANSVGSSDGSVSSAVGHPNEVTAPYVGPQPDKSFPKEDLALMPAFSLWHSGHLSDLVPNIIVYLKGDAVTWRSFQENANFLMDLYLAIKADPTGPCASAYCGKQEVKVFLKDIESNLRVSLDIFLNRCLSLEGGSTKERVKVMAYFWDLLPQLGLPEPRSLPPMTRFSGDSDVPILTSDRIVATLCAGATLTSGLKSSRSTGSVAQGSPPMGRAEKGQPPAMAALAKNIHRFFVILFGETAVSAQQFDSKKAPEPLIRFILDFLRRDYDPICLAFVQAQRDLDPRAAWVKDIRASLGNLFRYHSNGVSPFCNLINARLRTGSGHIDMPAFEAIMRRYLELLFPKHQPVEKLDLNNVLMAAKDTSLVTILAYFSTRFDTEQESMDSLRLWIAEAIIIWIQKVLDADHRQGGMLVKSAKGGEYRPENLAILRAEFARLKVYTGGLKSGLDGEAIFCSERVKTDVLQLQKFLKGCGAELADVQAFVSLCQIIPVK